MEVYMIDFGLASHVSEDQSLWHMHFHDQQQVGTPGYYLRDLVNFQSQSPIEQKCKDRFNHGFSSSIFNDRVAMSKMIAELMMGPYISQNVVSMEFKWYRFQYKSWIAWFVKHQPNECATIDDHRRCCLVQREIWNQYIYFNNFLVDFTDPQLYHDPEKTVDYWMEGFYASIKTNPNP
jgi:hypothetical protein